MAAKKTPRAAGTRKAAAKKSPGAAAKKAREPTPAAILKKVEAVSDSAKVLAREVKTMTKVFGENQKVLVSMASMIDSLAGAMEQIQKQSRQMNILEEDTQKLFAGLGQARAQAGLVSRINDQTARLQEQVRRIEADARGSGAEKLSQKVSQSMDGIRNNSQMIIKMAQGIDGIRDELRKVSAKTDAAASLGRELEEIRAEIKSLGGRADAAARSGAEAASLGEELQKLAQKTQALSGLAADVSGIRGQIEGIAAKAGGIDSLAGAIEGMEKQFGEISARVQALDMTGRLEVIQAEVSSLAKRAESTAFVGEEVKSVRGELDGFRSGVLERTEGIERKVSSLADTARRSEASASEFHAKTDAVLQEMRKTREEAGRAAGESSREVVALLKLSEYQSIMRMNSESKYGGTAELGNMASQTARIVNLFDGLSVETQERIPVPHEVRRWAVARILDCADRWEVRFSDVFGILVDGLGRALLKESLSVRQVRDIYGIRAVDEVRGELGIS